MGHVRVGRLPMRYGWSAVVAALADAESPEQDLLKAATLAAGKTLADVKFQDSLAYCYWLFLQMAAATRGPDFRQALRAIGVQVPEQDSGLAVLTAASNLAGDTLQRNGWLGIADEIALQTFRSTVTGVIGDESVSLFGSTIETARSALRKYSTERGVGVFGRRFFSEYAYRLLSRALGREAASAIGSGNRFTTSDDLGLFDRRLRAYCWDISKLVEVYAGDWFSKHAWLGDIDLSTTQGFTSYAISKLLSETTRELN